MQQPDLGPDQTRLITSFKTAWTKVLDRAKVAGRWNDNRHTLVTEFAESGSGDDVIMSIAGHVSQATFLSAREDSPFRQYFPTMLALTPSRRAASVLVIHWFDI